jgi:mannosylglycerate hydrolase
MIDRLIDLLESDNHFHSFTLDGQTILINDYLEIRPDQRERLEALIRSQKLIVGPWFILPDLFLVSGESIIRNLQAGMKMSSDFGATMQEGYVPDPFGHIAQLPQVLNKLGIKSFIFMRGLDSKSKKEAGSIFNWQSPDGSRVLTSYIMDGYFNAGNLGHTEQFGRFDGSEPTLDQALKSIRETIEKLEPLQQEKTFLLNNGFDHMPEQPELPGLIETINNTDPDIHLIHGTFRDYFDAIRKEGLPHSIVEGDLLGNVDHPILSSVFSTRVYLKQANHRAQSLLEKYVEPMYVYVRRTLGHQASEHFMDYAWKLLMENHPHDDICGCSHDGVHEDNEVRFRQVIELCESMMVEMLETMLKSASTDAKEAIPAGKDETAVFVYNPHPWPVKTRVQTTILYADPASEFGDAVPDGALVLRSADGTQLPIQVLSTTERAVRNNFLETSWGRQYEVLFDAEIPATGYHTYTISRLPLPTSHSLLPSLESSAPRSPLTPETHSPLPTPHSLLFEFQPDHGDTYTFGPDPAGAIYYATLESESAHPTLPDTTQLIHTLEVPESRHSQGKTTIRITTNVSTQHDGSTALDISYTNTAKDGRLRLLLPVGFEAPSAIADGHFRLAERHKPAFQSPETHPDLYTKYPGELNYPTLHMNDFAVFRGPEHHAWFAARGNHEFEIVTQGSETLFAITLHRAVGHLSTYGGRIRRVQAGPAIATPAAQCLRPITAKVAFGTTPASEQGFDLATTQARGFAHPCWVREVPYLPRLRARVPQAARASLLALDNPRIVLSAFRLHQNDSKAVLRCYNVSGEQETVQVSELKGFTKWCSADLREQWNDSDVREVGPDGTITLAFSPYEIRTILLK